MKDGHDFQNPEGLISRTTDGGKTWVSQRALLNGQFNTLSTIGDSAILAIGQNTILSSEDGGKNWSKNIASYNTLNGLFFIGHRNGWAIGDNGEILRSIDNGETWTEQESGTTSRLNSCYFIDLSTGWVAGNDGTILHTKDKGETWKPQESGTTLSLNHIQFIDHNTGWAVGGAFNNSLLLYTTNGGTTWNDATSKITDQLRDYNEPLQPFRSVYFRNATTGWIAGTNGIFHTKDGGETWEIQTNKSSWSMFFTNISTGWATGIYGEIIHTSDRGETWTLQNSGIEKGRLYSIYFIDHLNGWATGKETSGKPIILHTVDGGNRWTLQESGNTEIFNAIHFTDHDNGVAVGQNGTIFRYSTLKD